jgi:6,7-dimethyl-8-ribityllumazine synthase
MRTLPILRPSEPSSVTSSPSEIAVAEFSGEPEGRGRRVVVVASRFNESITTALAEGAVSALIGKGVALDDVDVLWVPGAWELPVAVRRALATGRYDAAVAVGAVIRGDTPHFDIVANESSRGLMEAARDFDVPVTLGLLTTDNLAQAESRAGGDHGNKGEDAALAALELLDLFDRALPADDEDEA